MQIFINGAISGLIIAVLALAFTIVYLPTRVFHIAFGGIYASVPFIAWICLMYGWPWQFATIAAVLAGVFLSISCELINHAPLERKNAGPGVHLVSSLGIHIMLVQTIVLFWGNEPKQLRLGLANVITLGNIVITQAQIIAVAVSVVLLFFFFIWLRFSNRGLQFKALSDNPKEFALWGYNIYYLRLVSFGISGILCSAASLLSAFDTGFDPYAGFVVLFLALVAMIIGGRLSFFGPVIGGILLGIVRSEVSWFFTARWEEAATFLLLCFFLFIKPNGLLGRKVRIEAEV